MRINFDRLSQLAGLPSNGNNKRGLYEGKGHDEEQTSEMDHSSDEGMAYEEEKLPEMAFDPNELSEEDESEGMMYEEEDEPEMEMDMEMDMDMDMEEMIDVDEAMLVQELRRAKKIIKEHKRRNLREARQKQIFQNQLKQVIDEEVQSVMDEMNLTAGWVYGGNKPRNSRQGYTNQGNMMPGFGFKR